MAAEEVCQNQKMFIVSTQEFGEVFQGRENTITFVEMAVCSVFKYRYLYLLYLPEELQ